MKHHKSCPSKATKRKSQLINFTQLRFFLLLKKNGVKAPPHSYLEPKIWVNPQRFRSNEGLALN